MGAVPFRASHLLQPWVSRMVLEELNVKALIVPTGLVTEKGRLDFLVNQQGEVFWAFDGEGTGKRVPEQILLDIAEADRALTFQPTAVDRRAHEPEPD